MYGNREEQGQLLQQVLTASDTDADEERIPGEGPRPVSVKKMIHRDVKLSKMTISISHLMRPTTKMLMNFFSLDRT